MNQNEIVAAVASASGHTKAETAKLLEAITDTIVTALQAGDDIRINGFGTFAISARKARVGRNPRTGEAIDIAASKVATFSPSKTLKDSLNP